MGPYYFPLDTSQFLISATKTICRIENEKGVNQKFQ